MAVKRTKEAVKVDDEQLRGYELVLIFSPEVTEDGLDVAISKVTQFITAKGGNSSEVEPWGKKKLAYPIRHFIEGSYVLIRFTMKPKLTKELEANLHISEEILRHLLRRLDD